MKHKFQNPSLKALAKRLVLLDSPRNTVKEYAEGFGIVLDVVTHGNLGRNADELLHETELDLEYTDNGAHLYPERLLKRVFKPVFRALDEAAKAEIRGS